MTKEQIDKACGYGILIVFIVVVWCFIVLTLDGVHSGNTRTKANELNYFTALKINKKETIEINEQYLEVMRNIVNGHNKKLEGCNVSCGVKK